MELLGPRQLQIMSLLWDKGPATVHTVVDLLADPTKPKVHYTTVLTVMNNMKNRGFCSHEKDGKQFLFKPQITRTEYRLGVLRETCRALFDGNVAVMRDFIDEKLP